MKKERIKLIVAVVLWIIFFGIVYSKIRARIWGMKIRICTCPIICSNSVNATVTNISNSEEEMGI